MMGEEHVPVGTLQRPAGVAGHPAAPPADNGGGAEDMDCGGGGGGEGEAVAAAPLPSAAAAWSSELSRSLLAAAGACDGLSGRSLRKVG